MAGAFLEEWRMRRWPSRQTCAGHWGQMAFTSDSQWSSLRRKKRSAVYSVEPSCAASPPRVNKGMRTECPFSDQVFQTSRR